MQWIAIKLASSEIGRNSDDSKEVDYYVTHIESEWSLHYSIHIQLEQFIESLTGQLLDSVIDLRKRDAVLVSLCFDTAGTK